VTRILITGMSGTGKSSVIARLAALGHEAIDADANRWSEWAVVPIPGAPPGSPPEMDWVWREDRIRELLDRSRAGALFVSGCAPNQGRFRDRFDHVVLLSAPPAVILERIAIRTTNAFGKSPAERAKILDDLRTVEPLLRRSADIEIDTAAASLDEVVDRIARLAG
jgi:broad-specificity NMP kinase